VRQVGARYVALIRGINLGSAKRVAMAGLRAAILDRGYTQVCTVLNSGNLVLRAPEMDCADIAADVEEVLVDRFGLSARVLVLTSAEWVAILRDNPFADAAANPSRLAVAFLFDPRDRVRLEPLLARNWAPDTLALGERVAYLWCPEGTVGRPLVQAIDLVVGDAVTTRTLATVVRILALLLEPPLRAPEARDPQSGKDK